MAIKKHYDDLVKIGIIINNELNEEGRELFYSFFNCSDTKYNAEKFNRTFDNFKNKKDNKLTIGTMKMLPKKLALISTNNYLKVKMVQSYQ